MSDLEKGSSGPTDSDPAHAEPHLGLAGNMARFFINSPLSPLLYLAMLMLGILGLMATPRQEDPQISVPMVDLIVQYPGAEPDQVLHGRDMTPLLEEPESAAGAAEWNNTATMMTYTRNTYTADAMAEKLFAAMPGEFSDVGEARQEVLRFLDAAKALR